MIYAIYIAIFFVSFLSVLNGFLRGRKKQQIATVLGFLLAGFIILSVLVANWKFGIFSIIVAFISAILGRPIAARLASKILSMYDKNVGSYVGLPSRQLNGISQQLDGSSDTAAAIEKLLDYCQQQSEIKILLDEYNVSRDDLRNLYWELTVGAGQWCCGHWVAASALAYPAPLRYLIDWKRGSLKTSHMEVTYNLVMYFERGLPLSRAIDSKNEHEVTMKGTKQ